MLGVITLTELYALLDYSDESCRYSVRTVNWATHACSRVSEHKLKFKGVFSSQNIVGSIFVELILFNDISNMYNDKLWSIQRYILNYYNYRSSFVMLLLYLSKLDIICFWIFTGFLDKQKWAEMEDLLPYVKCTHSALSGI